jgi:ATP-dependent RNA helicase HelY
MRNPAHGEFPVTKMLAELARDDLLPAILFRTSRRQCDLDIERLEGARVARLNPEEQEQLSREVDQVAEKYKMDVQIIRAHAHYGALLTCGAGAHHAGQLLLWRLVLEELMTRGKLRLMIATGTVAAGVDFPARTVVITAHSKRGSEGFNVLTASEFQQMSGRAGRRGRDAVGLCVLAPGAYCDARVLQEVIDRPPEPLRSAYFAAPATVLNLLKFRNVDDLHFTVQRSLAAFLDRRAAQRIRAEVVAEQEQLTRTSSGSEEAKRKVEKRLRRSLREADILETRQEMFLRDALRGLEHLGYVVNGSLTEKGTWAASLWTSLVLELGEAIADFLFSDLTMPELVALVGSIAADPHRGYLSIRQNPIKKEHFKKMSIVLERVRSCYVNPAASEIAVVPDAAVTLLSWMEASSWDEFSALLRLSGVAEGDVARLVSQTADHLNQISRLTESHPELAALAAEGRRAILKPPLTEAVVVAE